MVEPDLVSTHPGGINGFFNYPSELQPSTTGAPLQGETVRALTFSYDPTAPGMNDNTMWQAINEAIGGTLEIDFVHASEYQQRLATTIAGGDIPDLVSINRDVQGLPEMLEATFADLTEYLSGDAVLDYPNLAALPTESWRSSVVSGKIWGVPIPRLPIPGVPFVRNDLIAGAGLPTEPQNIDEFKVLLEGLVDEQRSTWACGDPTSVLGWILASMGGTDDWIEDGGSFIHGFETEEYEQALADTRELTDAGVFHPDSISATNSQRNDWFTYGTTPMVFGGYAGWSKYPMWGEAVPGFELGTLNLFAYDSSSQPVHPRGNVKLSMTVIGRADPDQIRMRLALVDWLAAPFGSAEHLLTNYGTEGETYTLDGTNPVRNDRGQTMSTVPFSYLGSGPQTIFTPGKDEVTQGQFDYQEAALPVLARDPTLGLYSEAASSKNQQLLTALQDAREGILAGREDVSTWSDAVAQWRADGGDEIRAEYESAFADA